MDKEYLHEKLAGMRDKYIGSTCEINLSSHSGALSERRLQKIKKKLVSLEMERCYHQIEHLDCRKLDEKITAQKTLLEQCRRRG